MVEPIIRNKTYFLSDTHLGASYLDNHKERERMIVDFLERIVSDARQLYLVGDILDYWFDYRYVVPRGYVRFFAALAKLVDSGVKVTWLIGNHDIWMFGYLHEELGVEFVDGAIETEISGKKFYITHGDSIGELHTSFKFIRWLFRNRFCQKLYSAIHPRWTVGFAFNWSSSNRKFETKAMPIFEGKMKVGIERWCKKYISENPHINYIVIGHHHVAVQEMLSDTAELVILGDCIYNYTYAVFDGESLCIKHFDTQKYKFNKNSQM